MRVLNITNTAVDLNAQVAPFLPNNTLVCHNPSAGALTLQESDSGTGDWTTVSGGNAIGAGLMAEVQPIKQYVRVSTSATLQLLGN